MSLKYWQYRASFALAPYFHRSFPVHLDIEVAGKCQLACTMCPYGTGEFDESKQGMMDREICEMALIEGAKYGAKSVKLNYRGEPGLCSYLDEAVSLANGLGYIEVAINTNLTAFSTRRLQKVCNAGLDLIIISMDGATKKTYESIRINGDFAKLVDNLEWLNVYRIDHPKPKVRIQMVVQDKNRDEIGLMQKYRMWCDEMVFQRLRQDNSGERKRCPQPHQRLIVGWDGECYSCCSNWNKEWPVGKYPDQSLAEIWEGARANELRRISAHPESGYPCDKCLVGGSYK